MVTSKQALYKKFDILMDQLRKDPLTDVREERRAYRKLENKTEKLIKKIKKPCKFDPPVINMLKNKKITLSRKYLHCENTEKSFKCKKFDFEKLFNNSTYNSIVIPVHIENLVHGKAHLNILVINKNKKTIHRIDPSKEKNTKITNDKFKKGIEKFFKKWSLKFKGFSYKSKIILHGGLCRFATPALYLYGRKLTHRLLKKCIINYLINRKKNICKKYTK